MWRRSLGPVLLLLTYWLWCRLYAEEIKKYREAANKKRNNSDSKLKPNDSSAGKGNSSIPENAKDVYCELPGAHHGFTQVLLLITACVMLFLISSYCRRGL
jgi:hypothetical protein